MMDPIIESDWGFQVLIPVSAVNKDLALQNTLFKIFGAYSAEPSKDWQEYCEIQQEYKVLYTYKSHKKLYNFYNGDFYWNLDLEDYLVQHNISFFRKSYPVEIGPGKVRIFYPPEEIDITFDVDDPGDGNDYVLDFPIDTESMDFRPASNCGIRRLRKAISAYPWIQKYLNGCVVMPEHSS